MMNDRDEKLLEYLKEIFEHLCVLKSIPFQWKKDLGNKLADLQIAIEESVENKEGEE